jgi:hypothetical protein
MPKMTMKETIAKQIAARSRYAAAAREFRESFAELYALDRLLANRGHDHNWFGEIPDIVSLRHAHAAPDLSGSIQADAMRIIETTVIEG